MLVAEVEGDYVLLGAADELDCLTWDGLQRIHAGAPGQVAHAAGIDRDVAAAALERLALRRVVLRADDSAYHALTTLLPV